MTKVPLRQQDAHLSSRIRAIKTSYLDRVNHEHKKVTLKGLGDNGTDLDVIAFPLTPADLMYIDESKDAAGRALRAMIATARDNLESRELIFSRNDFQYISIYLDPEVLWHYMRETDWRMPEGGLAELTEMLSQAPKDEAEARDLLASLSAYVGGLNAQDDGVVPAVGES